MAKKKEILLVEDSKADVELVMRASSKAKMECNISVVNNGQEAVDYLNKVEPYLDSPAPDLILLDLNMPGVNGLSFLKTIKSNEHFGHIPVVVHTTSNAREDIEACYKNHASAYLVKSFDIEDSVKMFKKLNDFWFLTCKLPST